MHYIAYCPMHEKTTDYDKGTVGKEKNYWLADTITANSVCSLFTARTVSFLKEITLVPTTVLIYQEYVTKLCFAATYCFETQRNKDCVHSHLYKHVNKSYSVGYYWAGLRHTRLPKQRQSLQGIVDSFFCICFEEIHC